MVIDQNKQTIYCDYCPIIEEIVYTTSPSGNPLAWFKYKWNKIYASSSGSTTICITQARDWCGECDPSTGLRVPVDK